MWAIGVYRRRCLSAIPVFLRSLVLKLMYKF